jgi:hypothetical protein
MEERYPPNGLFLWYFVLCEVYRQHPIHPSAWKAGSPKVAVPPFSEVPHRPAPMLQVPAKHSVCALRLLGVFAKVPHSRTRAEALRRGNKASARVFFITPARLGGLEPPRSHGRSLALWTSPAGYRSGKPWLTICVIPVAIT